MDDTEKHKLNRQFYTQVTIQMKQKTRLLSYVLISLVVEVLIPSLNLSSMYIVNIIYIFSIQSLELTIRIRSDRFQIRPAKVWRNKAERDRLPLL